MLMIQRLLRRIARQILIDERDRYLAHKIRTAPGQRIVAVVGAGHAPGIKRYWNDAILVDTFTGEVIDVIHHFFW